MLIRLGIPSSFRRFTAACADLGAPILVASNAFWNPERQRFPTLSSNLFSGCDVALDSSGFVAMLLYSGYRWPVSAYVSFAASHPFKWWAAMDYCCEREVAADRQEVLRRVRETVRGLKACQDEAASQGATPPMPVLQGWKPDDYLRCYDQMGGLPLPDLLGLGSVCRRHLGGPDGLLTIIATLDRVLPQRHKLHLFGVKGTAIPELAGHPRIHSVDSMAWDAAARREKGERSCTVDYRIDHLCRWYATNRSLLTDSPQLRMAV